MPAQNTTVTAEQQVYRQHHRDEQFWTPAQPLTADQIEFVTTPADKPLRRGQFRRGYDPRRHVFTPDECSRGFWAAIDSIITRYPNAIMADGRHIACNFLKNRSPHNYDRARNRQPATIIF
jgi:hypothetical protein